MLLALVFAAVALLAFILWKRLASDRLQLLNDQRRGSSQLVSRGEFVDGNRHLPVALALTDASFLRLRCFSQTFEFVPPSRQRAEVEIPPAAASYVGRSVGIVVSCTILVRGTSSSPFRLLS